MFWNVCCFRLKRLEMRISIYLIIVKPVVLLPVLLVHFAGVFFFLRWSEGLPCLLIHMIFEYHMDLYTMSRVHLVWYKTLMLDIACNCSTSFFHAFRAYTVIGNFDFYHFILLSVTLTLHGSHKVSTKQCLLSYFSHTLSSDEDEIWSGEEAIQAEHPETTFD